MNKWDVVKGDDEQFLHLLARYSEMLDAGADADPSSDPTLSADMRLRLQQSLDCLRRLRRLGKRSPSEEAVTQIMGNDITLHDGHVGGQVGRFGIVRTLGQGGGGTVFLAFDPDLCREVALKIPHLPALLAPELRRRFLREARAAARLDHPNLVPVHEVGEANGVCFLVSAYCRGGSLARWLAARTTPVPVRQAAELVALLADAVQYVHDHGIFHRDLKPGNILLDTAASQRTLELGFTPRLTDFGLAKEMDSDSGLAGHGTFVGTPSYMAPEQFECRSDAIDRRTDVYGLGAVLYELLTGRPPFKGATDSETLDQVLFQEPVGPRRVRRGVPRDLEKICLKCLEKLPERRYASAAELAGDLRRFLAHEPIQARPPQSAYRIGKWMRRHPWKSTAIASVGLTMLGFLLGGLWLQEMKRTHDANLKLALRVQEEQEEAIRQKEQRLRQYHYADNIVLAARHWNKRRLDELTNQLRVYRRSSDAVGSDDPRGFEWYYLSHQAHALRCRIGCPETFLLCVAFSPEGKTCVSGHEDGAIRLWDRVSGKLLHTLVGHKLPVYALAYSSDGKYLVSGGGKATDHSNKGELHIWDTTTLKSRPILADQLGSINSLALSPDGRFVATGLADQRVNIWEMPSGKLRKTIPLSAGVATVVFRSNTSLAVGLFDGTIVLHDTVEGRDLISWRGHPKDVLSLAHIPASGLLVSGGQDNAVRWWDRDTGRQRGEYHHDCAVCGVAVSPDGRTLASLSEEGVVKLYDVQSGQQRSWFAIPANPGRSVAFSPDGKDLAVGTQDGNLWLFDVSRTTGTASWLGHRYGPVPREAWAVAFSPDGKTLASAGDDNRICFWDPANGRLLKCLCGHQALVSCLAFSADGKLLASGSFDKRANVKVWDAATGAQVATLSGHSQPIYALAFAPNGKWLATSGRDHITRLWDLTTATDTPIFAGENIESLAFSPDGRTLALASDTHNLLLWDMEHRQIRQVSLRHPYGHVALAFSPDGQTLATGDTEGVVCFFDAATGQLRFISQSRGHIINCLAFSPDSKTLASAGFDKKVELWQVSTGRKLLTLPEQKDRVRWLAFSPDGTRLATAGHDGILTIHRTDPGEPRP